MADFLLEIGVEEVPSSELDRGLSELKSSTEQLMVNHRLEYTKVSVFGTPRRMVVYVKGMTDEQKPTVEEVRGPAKAFAFDNQDKPTKAATGFASSQGVKVEELITKEVSGKDYIFAVKSYKGQQTRQILSEIIPGLIQNIHFRKAMRWDSSQFRFIRPVRWITAILGSELVPFKLGELESSLQTKGHRFLGDKEIKLTNASDYIKILQDNKVEVDHEARAKQIKSQVAAAAEEVNGRPVLNDKVFSEVVNLVEFPHVILGDFKKEFLDLPREVLITAMESHQRYFPIEDNNGQLLPNFIVVHNGDPGQAEIIKSGHERVLTARLADARFFYQEDLKIKLADRVDSLNGLNFQDELGTIYQKTKRIEKISEKFIDILNLNGELRKIVKRAAFLSKADLLSEMVIEFPDLQGTMGHVYAMKSGEPESVAEAIGEHWLPISASGIIPGSVAGRILSIADKVDSICGCFLAGLIPSGSEDPYALRRQSAGIINIIIESSMNFNFGFLVQSTFDYYRDDGVTPDDSPALISQVSQFFLDRFNKLLVNRGFRYDSLNAVFANTTDDINFLNLYKRLEAIEEIRESQEFENIIIGFSRLNNLSLSELGIALNENLLTEKEEKELYKLVSHDQKRLTKSLNDEDFRTSLNILAKWKIPIDNLFDEVLIMDKNEKIKQNRLMLLNFCLQNYLIIADFSKIVIPGITNNEK